MLKRTNPHAIRSNHNRARLRIQLKLNALEEELHATDSTMKALMDLVEYRENLRTQAAKLRVRLMSYVR